ncbi:S-layer homology domain-containing protein [Bacillus dakarensis]|uniref:S-layer homology domain-containing protein n=1 Tax=Robertmurraya dakarensis TaxID=1926278 RepID=UPI000981718D|nr:S-layer homology domain-containing protein [Bacillus dakarensis]
MKVSWKKKVLPSLLALTLAFSFGSAVQAEKGNNGKGQNKEKVEEKKEEKNEQKPVTKLESVVAVMSLLEEKLDLEPEDDSDLDSKIPDWAKEHVQLALDYEIVSTEEIKEYKKPAARLFVTKLLVKATGTEIDEDEIGDLSYHDIKKLSDEEKAYLSFALEEDLIMEYENEKAFKPNKPVTHGEMENFIKSLSDKIDDDEFNLKDVDFQFKQLSDGNDEGKFKEAVITGKKVKTSIPNLKNKDLWIIWNNDNKKLVDLDRLDGTQDDGYETAKLLEKAIADALRQDRRVEVSYDRSNLRFIFETISRRPFQNAPSLQFDGDKDVLKALGLDNSRAVGSLNGKESWAISVESHSFKDEIYYLKILLNDTYFTEVEISVDERDSEGEIAEKLYEALKTNYKTKSDFVIDLDDETVILTMKNAKDVEIELVITED